MKRGRAPTAAGRPSKGKQSNIAKAAKANRPHNLAYCTSRNMPLGKRHSKGMQWRAQYMCSIEWVHHSSVISLFTNFNFSQNLAYFFFWGGESSPDLNLSHFCIVLSTLSLFLMNIDKPYIKSMESVRWVLSKNVKKLKIYYDVTGEFPYIAQKSYWFHWYMVYPYPIKNCWAAFLNSTGMRKIEIGLGLHPLLRETVWFLEFHFCVFQ